MSIKRPESSRDCMDGTPDEDHDWHYEAGDDSVGIVGGWVCRYCDKVHPKSADMDPPSDPEYDY